ncbi:hypothetical protein [Planococcus shixiaomingii]|uniref:hypothetical protein n=1 Tax=Planococcus shixiaomingii TaxID=3058393 RepID=UPI0026131604|nr:hypothetical protein [Planococcus sp. N022]WKA53202.1 hypothetical protein QWY21_11080 [Planococcus sp. N022]
MEEKKPFDDGNEFILKHLGIPAGVSSGKKNAKLPMPLRIFQYFIVGFVVLSFVLVFISYIVN